MFEELRNAVSTNPDIKLDRFDSISDILGFILNILIGVSFGISIVAIAISMIKYIMSAGDPKNTQQAWNTFIWGIIAGAVTVGAFAIKLAVLSALGVDTPEITDELPGI